MNIIVAPGTRARSHSRDLPAPTTAFPVTFGVRSEPVSLRHVASLGRTAAAIATGVDFFNIELQARPVQMLRDLVPAAERVALFVDPTDRSNESTLRDVETAAIGQRILTFEASTGRGSKEPCDASAEKVDALLSLEALFATRRVQLTGWPQAIPFLRSSRDALLSTPAD